MARSDLKAATGVLFVDDPAGQRELPTATCPHCNRVVLVGSEDGGWCFRCARLLCQGARCLADCQPFLARVEASLRRDRLRGA